ncbi:MAG: hypothetical protein C0515_04610, partial [Novosphingobium sp.]|nr:hypothetical protein [Novosphingobium sp.]MBX9644427.1 hypothetical protein [Novosphingobium sp.]
MQPNTLIALALVPLLAACASGGTRPAPTVPAKQPRVAVRTPVKTVPPVARIQAAPGLEGVIGADADALARQFGAARLEVWEGDARKLQFSGSACILDVYLYPAARGGEPQATYVEARRASDGQEVDRAACVAALRKR